MRKDIQLYIGLHDVALEAQNKYKLRGFEWVANSGGLSRYIYGEVTLQATLTEKQVFEKGFYVAIPYTPKYKEFMIRVKRVWEDESYGYLVNPVNGSEWFLVKVGKYGGEPQNIFASELITICEEGYYIRLENGIARLYSAYESDFNIVNADRQNANCMLACNPTNNYRYPISGVGLKRWVNSNNVHSTTLADVIQQEFNEDGVAVKNARYNYDTQQMEMDLDTSNAE